MRRVITYEVKKIAVSLFCEDGLTHAEIAEKLGVSVTSVRRWISLSQRRVSQTRVQQGQVNDQDLLNSLWQENAMLKNDNESLRRAIITLSKYIN